MTMARAAFRRGMDFPNEGFVDEAVYRWAAAQGCTDLVRPDDYGRHPDLVAVRPGGRGLVVEAKGKTDAIGTDFNTGLGQLLKHMDAEFADYAIAVPDTPGFRTQMALVPDRVRRLLGLSWLIVAADGSVVEVQPPCE